MNNQFLYIITGLPYSGKTTLTNKIAKRFGFTMVSVDEFLDSGNYVVEKMTQDDWNMVYSQAYEKLKRCLSEEKTVIFDGGSLKKSERQTLKNIAESMNIPSKLIYINTTKKEIEKRRVKNQVTKERGHLEDVTMQTALNMFEEPESVENPILYNQEMDLAIWIKENIK